MNSVLRFLTTARGRGMLVTGPMLKSLAERQARKVLMDLRPLRAGWGRLRLDTASQERNPLGKLVQ